MPATLLSEAEYAALPDSVQRKYFSSLERMRLADRSAIPPPDVNRLPRRPHTARSPRSASQSRSQSRGRRRLRKANAPHDDRGISEAEAQWFLSLPDKIIKTCLSREEAILLAGRCETFLVDSDGSSSKFDSPSEQDVTFLPAEKRRRSTQEDSVIDTHLFPNEHAVGDSPTPPEEMSPPPDPPRPSGSQRRTSFRRTMSLTAGPFTRLSTSSAPPLPSPVFPVPQDRRPRATTNIVNPRYVEATKPKTKHYQDPEARMKLRLYLASPQNFDEAVEYGFPSSKQPVESPHEPSPSDFNARQASRDVQTFLRDDSVSFLGNSDIEEDSDGYSSVGEPDTPVTPLDHETFRGSTPIPKSNYSSLDSNGLPSIRSRPNRHQDLHVGTREMTLRMTLTRPDLRADEEALYSWQQEKGRDNPLALEKLPPMTDDTTGMHGPFAASAKQGSLVKKILQKVKKAKQ